MRDHEPDQEFGWLSLSLSLEYLLYKSLEYLLYE